MELSLTSSLLLCLLPIVYFLYQKLQGPVKQRHAHGLRVYPIVGTLPHFVKNRHRFLEWSTDVMQSSPTNTMFLKVLGRPTSVFIANPANVEHVLKANFGNYPKGELNDIFHDFLGDGIFNCDGERWLLQRRAASYEFSQRSLRNFVVHAVHSELVERLLPLLERAADAGGETTLDVQDVLERFAFDNVCRVAFNDDPACLTEESMMSAHQSVDFKHAFEVAMNMATGRFMSPAWLRRLMKLLQLGPERQMSKALATIHGYADKIIQERRESGEACKAKDDLLSRFAAFGEHSDESLRYMIMNVILAGRESTSSSLTWLFWLVSTRPDVHHKILSEVRAVRASSRAAAGATTTTTFGFDELGKMHYLHAAITESMRLYPSAALNMRNCNGDDTLPDGTVVRKGSPMIICAYAMARLEAVWGKDCETFRPERWLDEAGAFRPENPCKYPVFSAGPRTCLGKEMAYIQMKSIAACVYERFTLRYVGTEAHRGLELAGTLRMAGGLPMQISRMA